MLNDLIYSIYTAICFRFFNITIYTCIFSLRPYDASRFDDFPPSISTENDDSTLVLKGLVVDPVQKVGEKAPDWKGQDSSKWPDSVRSVLGRWRSLLPDSSYYRTGEDYPISLVNSARHI